jgi:hypothetical protein
MVMNTTYYMGEELMTMNFENMYSHLMLDCYWIGMGVKILYYGMLSLEDYYE